MEVMQKPEAMLHKSEQGSNPMAFFASLCGAYAVARPADATQRVWLAGTDPLGRYRLSRTQAPLLAEDFREGTLIHRPRTRAVRSMAKGLKKTTETIAISFSVDESAANTFTETTVSLPLDPLNNEVFVVQAINVDPFSPDALASTDTSILVNVSTVPQATISNLSDPQVLAIGSRAIRAAGFADGGVGFSHSSMETPTAEMDYIAIIATNDFNVSVLGVNNLVPKGASGRMWGYRAKAEPSIYAALVQSELLS